MKWHDISQTQIINSDNVIISNTVTEAKQVITAEMLTRNLKFSVPKKVTIEADRNKQTKKRQPKSQHMSRCRVLEI